MKKYLFLIITIILVLVLITVLILVKKDGFSIKELGKDNIIADINKNGAAILYTGNLNNEIKNKLKQYYKDYRILCYSSNLSKEEQNDLISDLDKEVVDNDNFIIFMNGEVVDFVEVDNTTRTVELLEKYLYNIIPESERYYKTLSTANEYIKKVNSNKYTVAVFGIDDCTYCDLYLPVINDIAKDYNLDIYYFKRDDYDEIEYEKIMALDFEIPAKCTTTGYPTSMKKSFPKPMTLITKGGKLVDCIRGYVVKDEVVDKLSEYKIIKE